MKSGSQMTSNIYKEEGYSYESLRMLESEEGQSNAVFAIFGSAAQHSQFYESALAEFLIVYNKITNKSLTIQDLGTIKTKLQKKTMGALLYEFRKYVTIDDSTVEQCLYNPLEKRNFLIHRFFLERNEKFRTKKGRMEMMQELLHIQEELEIATKLTNGMRIAVSKALDLKEGKEQDTPQETLFSIRLNIPE